MEYFDPSSSVPSFELTIPIQTQVFKMSFPSDHFQNDFARLRKITCRKSFVLKTTHWQFRMERYKLIFSVIEIGKMSL